MFFSMLHLKAVDDIIRFRVNGSSFHNTAALWLTDLSPAEVVDWYKWMLDLINSSVILMNFIVKSENLLLINISGNNSGWWINLRTKREHKKESKHQSVYKTMVQLYTAVVREKVILYEKQKN